MPEVTIGILNEEAKVLEAFYPDLEAAVRAVVRRTAKKLAAEVIDESDSKLNPRKLSAVELRNEINRLDTEAKIPVFSVKEAV